MLARGKGYISSSDLKDLLGIPQDVEILSITYSDSDRGYDISVISSEVVEGLTIDGEKLVSHNYTRRVPLPFKQKLNVSESV